jgi:nucleoside-diphosphate-sugar epimerase
LRVLDLRPPRAEGVEYVECSITDPEALKRALDRVDVFVSMVMQNPTDPHSNLATIDDITRNYQVNTLGLRLLLQTAHEMGVVFGVYSSTFTVHARNRNWYSGEEEVPLDNLGVYGFTKGLGERICRYFCREFGMSIAALRITDPRDRDGWVEGRKIPAEDPGHLWVTDESDLASSYLAAIDFVRGRTSRFDAFFIAGDETGQEVNLAKANQLLGWAPKAHLLPLN